MKHNLPLRLLASLILLVFIAGTSFAQTDTDSPAPKTKKTITKSAKTKSTKTTTKKKAMAHKNSDTTQTVTPTADNPKGYRGTDLVSISEIIPTIVVDSPLGRSDNAFKYQFFKKTDEAYIRYATAKKIAVVEKELEKRGLRIKVWAAYRPFPVQIKMYEIVGRDGNKVSDPFDPSSKKAHVRGVAIDCTLVDKDGKELEMPTGYCDFAENYHKMWMSYTDLPAQVIKNRALLHEVMLDHGMAGYSKEWWHFQDRDIDNYPAITMKDFPDINKAILVDELLKPQAKTDEKK